MNRKQARELEDAIRDFAAEQVRAAQSEEYEDRLLHENRAYAYWKLIQYILYIERGSGEG